MAWHDSLRRSVVLIVEDDLDARTIYRHALRVHGFDVREAVDGLEALRMIELSPPDLVVLDVRLPVLDGLSVREEIAAHAETRHVPVIIVTAFDLDPGRVRNARVMRKPISPDDLIDAVRTQLNR